jgi:hypothetical protein
MLRWRMISSGVLLLTLSGYGLVAAAEDEAPDDELLEFLGAWDDGQGNWIDPMTLDKDSAEEVTSDEQKQK